MGPRGPGRGKAGEKVLRQEELGVSEEQDGGHGPVSRGTQALCEVREVGWAEPVAPGPGILSGLQSPQGV